VDNGVPILNYYDDATDNELLELCAYLKTMLNCNDMRDINIK